MDKSDQKHVDKLRRRQGGSGRDNNQRTSQQSNNWSKPEPRIRRTRGLIDGDGGGGVGKAGDMSISFRDNDHISTLSIYIYKHINDISEYIRSQSVSKRSAVELGVKQTTYH